MMVDEDEMRALLRMILQADAEAPGYGLADAIDNEGEPYQSATLANALFRASCMLGMVPRGGKPA